MYRSVVEVVANSMSFAALKSDGSVATWGNSAAGGDSAAELTGYTKAKELGE